MKANCAGTTPKDTADDQAEIEEYLQYAQENIETSRMLFKGGHLRYAIFSANEGLELLAKAHMLRYKIIDKAITAKHFPYPAAVETMIKVTKSNIGKNPPNKKQLEEVLDSLSIPREAFKMVEGKKLEVPMWKSSLSISLTDDERARTDEFWKKLNEWSKKMTQIQNGQQYPSKQGSDKPTPDEPTKFFEAILEDYKKTKCRKDSRSPLLPGNRKMSSTVALDAEQALALAELTLFIGTIVRSSAHQQISRYPTRIAGVDAQEIYTECKDDVEKLLGQIYLASEVLIKQLRCKAPFTTLSIWLSWALT